MSDDVLSFARLVPVNQRARSLFTRTISKIISDRDEAALRFYTNDNLSLLVKSTSAEPPPQALDPVSAFASLSLDDAKQPSFPRIGWRVGHRAENIEIRIAEPGTIQTPPVCFRLFIHPRSVILILESHADAENPIAYRDRFQEIVLMRPREKLVLIREVTSILVAGCEFNIIYTLNPKNEMIFVDKAKSLFGSGLRDSAPVFPNNNPFVLGRYLCGKTIGNGTFGDIIQGVNVDTGEPAAVKVVRVLPQFRKAALDEIKYHETCNGGPHVLRLLDSWCGAHQMHPSSCPHGTQTENFCLALEAAYGNFREERFSKAPFANVLQCFRQTLFGIQEIHRHGIIHRDITRANMLYIESDPPRAAVSDFGKAVRASTNSDTRIGPIHTLAPEVKHRPRYTKAIDLWAWAYAAAEYLGYRCSNGSWITVKRLADIQAALEDVAVRRPETQPFANLLQKILVWDMDERPGVDEALENEVWYTNDQIGTQAETEEERGPKSSVRSRSKQELSSESVLEMQPSKKLRLESGSPKSIQADTVSTVPFSD